MKTSQRTLRLLVLIIMIALASFLPVPITFNKKENLPKFNIEQVDKKEDNAKKEDLKSII